MYVIRDKLEAGNYERRMKRQEGNQDSLLRKVRHCSQFWPTNNFDVRFFL
jgi:hypothetical protein